MHTLAIHFILLIILVAKWVSLLVLYNESKHNILAYQGKANKILQYNSCRNPSLG